mgnify:CR=1 FL=1
MHSEVLSLEAIRGYEKAGNILKSIRATLPRKIRHGSGLLDLVEYVEGETIRLGAMPAFPCNISINDVASHYTPSRDDRRTFEHGDVVKIDLGVCYDGYIADSAFTFEIDTEDHRRLIQAAERALEESIAVIKPGIYVSEIGRAISKAAAEDGYEVLRRLLGHSLSRHCLHGGLTIPAFDDGRKMKIREGDVLAIEPFLTTGKDDITERRKGNIYQLLRDDPIYAPDERGARLLKYISEKYDRFPFAERWLPDHPGLQELMRSAAIKSFPMLVTADGGVVAQAEHTVIVEKNGCRKIT